MHHVCTLRRYVDGWRACKLLAVVRECVEIRSLDLQLSAAVILSEVSKIWHLEWKERCIFSSLIYTPCNCAE